METYVTLRESGIQNRDAFVFVFRLDCRETFVTLDEFYNHYMEVHSKTKKDNLPPIILVGNMTDVVELGKPGYRPREVSQEEAIKLAEKYNAVTYLETSAKTGKNVWSGFAELVRELLA